jgi:hypothetical protein
MLAGYYLSYRGWYTSTSYPRYFSRAEALDRSLLRSVLEIVEDYIRRIDDRILRAGSS